MQSIEESVRLFNEGWAIYQKIIRNNYMFHREIGEAVSHYLAAYFGEKPIRLMDLGCGDASQTITAVSRCKLDYYHGCDVSAVALDLADENLVRADVKYVLENSDMLQCVAVPGLAFDVMFSSFAMHHLDHAQKSDFLKKVRAGLKPDGLLILVDLALNPGEDRAAYLENYLDYAEAHWSEITARENAAIRDHASSHDYPERLTTYRQLSMEAGFSEPLHLCRYTWHHVWVLRNQMPVN
jgi:cyclopropane fatty-acyl-phospholipid synthase-like methyltransferase